MDNLAFVASHEAIGSADVAKRDDEARVSRSSVASRRETLMRGCESAKLSTARKCR